MKSVTLDLLSHKRISSWAPKHGDKIYYKGWVSTWVGVVTGIHGHQVSVARAGTWVELVSYTQSELNKNTVNIDIGKIQKSKSLYTVDSIENGIGVLYV